MTNAPASDSDTILRLAELARANVSGPIGRKLVAQAQRQLVDSMVQKGLLAAEDASDLKM